MTPEELEKHAKKATDALERAQSAALRATTHEEIEAATKVTEVAMKDVKRSMDLIMAEINKVIG